MRVLLDENFPAELARCFTEVTVETVHSLGWAGIKNGELLRRARDVCEVFVTLDRNLPFQQNVVALSFGVVVVRARSNRMRDLILLVPAVTAAALTAKPGQVNVVGGAL